MQRERAVNHPSLEAAHDGAHLGLAGGAVARREDGLHQQTRQARLAPEAREVPVQIHSPRVVTDEAPTPSAQVVLDAQEAVGVGSDHGHDASIAGRAIHQALEQGEVGLDANPFHGVDAAHDRRRASRGAGTDAQREDGLVADAAPDHGHGGPAASEFSDLRQHLAISPIGTEPARLGEQAERTLSMPVRGACQILFGLGGPDGV